MTIEEMDETIEYLTDFCLYSPYQEAINQVNTYIKQMQADYETRLKADMVAMLTELQLEIEELDLNDSVPDYQKGADETREYIEDLLQQKIDALKEVVEDGK